MATPPAVKVSKRGQTLLPEVALSRGPLQMAVTGDGSYQTLFGSNWILYWHKKRGLILLQDQAGIWAEVVPGAPFPELPLSARHISLTFDQSARHMFAWQDNEQIQCRQWDAAAGQYVFRGPFAGVDPILICDATINYQIPGSDIVLYYLTLDRKALCYRVQNELYAIEHELYVFMEPVFLDQGIAHAYMLQLATSAGTLHSNLYPISLQDIQTAGFAPWTSGERFDVVVLADVQDIQTGNFAPWTSGELYEPVIERSAEDIQTAGFAPWTSGELYEPIIQRAAEDIQTAGFAPWTGGSLLLVVTVHDGPQQHIQTAAFAAFTGGSLNG